MHTLNILYSYSWSLTLVLRNATAVRHSGLTRFTRYSTFAVILWNQADSSTVVFVVDRTSNSVGDAGEDASFKLSQLPKMLFTQLHIVIFTSPLLVKSKDITT